MGRRNSLVEDGIVVAAGKAWMPASFSSLGMLCKHGTFPFSGCVHLQVATGNLFTQHSDHSSAAFVTTVPLCELQVLLPEHTEY